MSDKEARDLAQRVRPAAQLCNLAIGNMRRVLGDDALYLALLLEVGHWLSGERAWMQMLARSGSAAEQEVVHATAGERGDGNYEAARGTRFPLPLATGHPGDSGHTEPPGGAAGP